MGFDINLIWLLEPHTSLIKLTLQLNEVSNKERKKKDNFTLSKTIKKIHWLKGETGVGGDAS